MKMKWKLLLAALLVGIASGAVAVPPMLINNGKLQSYLDANGHGITNVSKAFLVDRLSGLIYEVCVSNGVLLLNNAEVGGGFDGDMAYGALERVGQIELSAGEGEGPATILFDPLTGYVTVSGAAGVAGDVWKGGVQGPDSEGTGAYMREHGHVNPMTNPGKLLFSDTAMEMMNKDGEVFFLSGTDTTYSPNPQFMFFYPVLGSYFPAFDFRTRTVNATTGNFEVINGRASDGSPLETMRIAAGSGGTLTELEVSGGKASINSADLATEDFVSAVTNQLRDLIDALLLSGDGGVQETQMVSYTASEIMYALTNGHLRVSFDRAKLSNSVSFIGANTNYIEGFGHDISAQHSDSWNGISFRVWDGGFGQYGSRVRIGGALHDSGGGASEVDIRSALVDVQAYLDSATLRIKEGNEGASIKGWITGGLIEIGAHSPGAEIRGDMADGASIRIGEWSMGARAQGRAYTGSKVVIGGTHDGVMTHSNAVGSLGLFQLCDTDNGDDTIYSNQYIYAAESIGLGAVHIEEGHKQSLVVGDGLRSVGRGMVNAYEYYRHGTNIFDLIAAAAGDITEAIAGAYLSGGGSSGSVTFNVTGLVSRVALNSVTSTVDSTGMVDLGTVAGGSAPTTMPTTPWVDYVDAYMTNLQAFGASSLTDVMYDSEVSDAGNVHSWGVVTFSSTGMIYINGWVSFGKIADGRQYDMRVRRNADVPKLAPSIYNGAAGASPTAEVIYQGYNDAATNRWRVALYQQDISARTNTAGSSATVQYTGLRAYRFRNAGE